MKTIENDIANILKENITFSGQVGDYVIHGAIEKIIEYFSDQKAIDDEAHRKKIQQIKIERNEYREIAEDFKVGIKSQRLEIAALQSQLEARDKLLEEMADDLRKMVVIEKRMASSGSVIREFT